MHVGIIGANGYSGIELIRHIQQHPNVTLNLIVSNSTSGKLITELYPHLQNIYEEQLQTLDVESIADQVDLLFFATPSRVSKDWIPAFMEKGIKCIDLSGDFRLKSAADYQKWYKAEHTNGAYLQEAAYGLCEVFAEDIAQSKLIANPGCYPTAALLALIPMVEQKLVSTNSIIIDGKSGASGAGRNPSLATHFGEINENVKAYKLGQHQHIPEIEQVLSEVNGEPVQVTFSTHLIPMTRGILCTIYLDLLEEKTTADILSVYENYYEGAPFVRVRPEGTWPATKEVYGSNFCDIGVLVDERTGKLTVVSVIDNVVKGASGQAIQNMNLLCGWDIQTGLNQIPVYP
ncbi:N-acetyl-gamma-glutamyl-phosphate reductase [Salinibacillus xinjiangensis]|uniref:N-acetyl-gamma-glutamyl-phosphate reductase n=1 Tax=Salinibacillus xinjiangensis TaxID=1229268 RepID=UPI001E2F21DE|nr:N-acetyl-gamma-glutamyl-phosphate reductase [Salinibacillus xinjiangensis]